jgi:hypothetical protein
MSRYRIVSRRAVSGAFAFVVLSSLATGCYEFQLAPGTPDLSQVVNAAESVLKERYYQVRVHRPSGHLYAYSPIEIEGAYPVMRRIDVNVMPERTGHYMPRVRVRKYIDEAEPPLESGDRLTHYDFEGSPFPDQDWTPLYYDGALEVELRRAILERLNVAA